MGYCTVDDVCSAFPQFTRNAPGSISDDQIQGWIDGVKARVRSVLLTRGTDPDNPDGGALTADQFAFVRELNREGAQADLSDALQGVVALQSGETAVGAQHRQNFERVLREVSQGLHDKLFRGSVAKTTDVEPVLGGTAGGETDPHLTPGRLHQNKAFGKDQIF